jgi:SAM-dependent methyltransferase
VLDPIVAGVPRMIRNAVAEYGDFYYRHRQFIGSLDGLSETARRLGRVDPRVFDRRSFESFSLQWSKYEYEDRTWFKDDADQRREEFLYNMQLSADDLNGKLVLDAGCGNGRLTAAVARYGAEVVGMDFSRSVERAAANAGSAAGPNAAIHFVQGKVLEPPFAPATFGHIHTSGVLHHTPDPLGAFRRFVALVEPGGRAYVQLYRRRRDLVGQVNRVMRVFTPRLPVRLLWWLCNAAVPIHSALVYLVARCRGEKTQIFKASRRERALSMFDNYSPPYQFRYTPEEVRRMFTDAGLTDIQDVTLANEARHMVAFVGTKG